uniref:Uncharacterized protein n=1 Tax=Acidobacterium capsulatum TaxID=33075 RepID=A0A7V4XRA7_9BACT
MDPYHLSTGASFFIFLMLMLIVLVSVVITIIPYWKIFTKAGFSPWLSLLVLLPIANIVILYVVAFSEWNIRPATPSSIPPSPMP